ncbi:laccase [Sulfuricella sp. T08]|uniref:peptidoglycan editing factor PgeF n=1 Tax=Sulfuricella sp. T08 TaxID=1632857 RepID=UPI0006179EA8|nr:peptidoglycan editing factor PgeF [Sulfuricella sp. T08]GAO35612.1 laccase [Sulfuricella sp. T08]
MNHSWIIPDWPAPANVRALQTTREGGVSVGAYATLNLGDHVGDDTVAVVRNRALLREALPADPVWLKQVHGNIVVDADRTVGVPDADAALSRQLGKVCAVMTADCLPLLICDEAGTVVAATHAGWRGLAGGVVEATVNAMNVAPERLMVWLGPAIGPAAFEVGEEVRQAFMARDPAAEKAFVPSPVVSNQDSTLDTQKWLADIYLLARQRLALLGVKQVYGGGLCTYTDAERFYSYRRDQATGRMASLIWLA